MVEPLLEADEIAAEPLVRRRRPAAGRRRVPVPRESPLGRVDAEPCRGEAVGEHLVHDGLEVPRGAAGARSGDEVVRVGHVEALEPCGVQPGVADVAAGEQPPVRRRRVPDREARAPPDVGLGLAVDLGPGDVRLAVPDVADGRRVDRGRTRHPQQHGHLVAELRGRLGDVELRAVVVRERRQHHYPLTAPRMRPWTMKRWRKKKRMTTGIAASTTPAQNGPHCCAYLSWMKL